VFGPQMFKNEIIWKRTTTKNDYTQGATNWPRVHDVMLYFAKNADNASFNQPFAPLSDEYVKSHYSLVDDSGRKYQLTDLTAPGSGMRGHPTYEFMGVTRFWRYNKEKMEGLAAEGRVIQPSPGAVPRYKRYLDEMKGVSMTDIWTDIPPINSQAQERLGYPTQKPEALLERIIKASSNEGDLVLDPFCGCGTTVQVAQRLNRRWIGIDITHLAIGLIKKRLSDAFGPDIKSTYDVIGEPTDYAGAAQLAAEDKYQFQWWALGQVGARPADQKKGADRGIDGRLYFHDDDSGKSKQIIFSVKAGGVSVPQVRDLRGVLEREKAEIGVFISFEEPTKPMLKEAAEAGFYKGGPLDQLVYPRIQILTIQQVIDGRQPEYPARRDATFKKAPRSRPAAAENLTLPLGLE